MPYNFHTGPQVLHSIQAITCDFGIYPANTAKSTSITKINTEMMQVHARFSKRRLLINLPSTSYRTSCRHFSRLPTRLGPKSIPTSSTVTTMVGQGLWLRPRRPATTKQAASTCTMPAAMARHGGGVAQARRWLRVMALHARRWSKSRAARIVSPSAMRGSTSREHDAMARAPLTHVPAKLAQLNVQRGST